MQLELRLHHVSCPHLLYIKLCVGCELQALLQKSYLTCIHMCQMHALIILVLLPRNAM